MKPFITFLWILLSFFQAYSQKNPHIRSGDLIKSAEEFYDSGQYKKSLSLYEQIDRNDSNYVKALYGRAINCDADSQFDKGIVLCEEAIHLKEQREMEPDIYNTYGNLLSHTGQKEKAITVFNEAISKYPAFTLLYFNKGVALFEEERYADAESVFKDALLINPYQYSVHFYLGLCAIHEGKIVPAFLSFTGYLLINPEGKYSKRCVNILSAISNATDEIQDFKAKRKEDGDENYSTVEEILLSKIALEKEYKLKVSMDDAIFRQIQVVFEKLEYKEEDSDFWMQYYVPWFKKLFTDGQFETFIFWAFENVQIKEIQDYNKKNKKTIENFTTNSAEYFNLIRATRLLPYVKRADQRVRYLYSNGLLQGKGELTEDKKNNLGSWIFYYPQGNIKATGQYNESGRDGNWTYYNYSGNLKAREIYKNGKLEGKQLYYSEKGLLTYEEFYSNGQQNGLQNAYRVSGQLFSTTIYKSGKMDGEYREYFASGQVSAISQYVNNILSGPFATYYNNGQLKESGNYLNGSLDGSVNEYYENGHLSSEGKIKNGKSDGEWKEYYDNGKLKTKSTFVNTKMEGIKEEYYEDGPLKETYTYKNGLLNGETVSYDKDQKPFARFQFSNDKLQSAIYFDKAGKTISTSDRKNNRVDLDIFLPDGTKSTHRIINEKGVIDGQETVYYPSGKIREVTEYKDGEKNGIHTENFPNGRKKSEETIKDGNLDGHAINYYSNGITESEGWTEDGKANGYWNYYDELGNLINTSYVVDGELSGFKTEYYPNGVKSIEKKFYKGILEEVKQFDSTGKLLIYDSFPRFSGKFLLLYPNGSKMQECNYVNGLFEGRLTQYYFDGSIEYIQYYKGGLLDSNYIGYDYHNVKMMEGQYKAGKKTGEWKYYNNEGRLESTTIYADDELNGSKHFFGDDNKIYGEINYRNDERQGSATNADPDGSLLYTVWYNEGNVLGYSYLDKDGKPIPEILADHGKLKLESFFQNGRPSRKCQYNDYTLNGSDILYFANGKMRSQDSLEYGIFEGLKKEYYPNGNPILIYNYKNNHLHGPCRDYNNKGILIREINYYNGDRHGEAKYYTENGALQETRYYYYGILMNVKK
jgi:uncharacterized protein